MIKKKSSKHVSKESNEVSKTKIQKSESAEREKKDPKSFLKSSRFKNSVLIILTITAIAGTLYSFKDVFVVALVNGKPVTRYEILSKLEKRGGKQTLDEIVTKTLIKQQAEKEGIVVTDKEITDEIDYILKQQGNTDLNEFLQLYGLTEQQLKEELGLKAMLKKLLANKIKPTDEEVKSYVEQNKDSLANSQSSDSSSQDTNNIAKIQLEEQKFNQEVTPYIEELKQKSNVTYWKNY